MERPRRFYPRILSRIDDFGIMGAVKARGVICIARAFIDCRLRIRTQRTSHGHALLRLIVYKLCSNELVRRDSLFHPALQRLVEIVVGIRARRKLSKGIWSRTAAAVL